MIAAYVGAVREWLLLVAGCALVVIAMLAPQLRRLAVGKEGLTVETWKREVVQAIQQKVTGTSHSVQTSGTLSSSGHLEVRKIPAAAAAEIEANARDAVEAESPAKFAEAVFRLANPDEYWPHIVEAQDSFGRRAGGAAKHAEGPAALVNSGDSVSFRINAVDPQARPLRYRLRLDGAAQAWTDSNILEWKVAQPAREFPVRVEVAAADEGPRAEADFDDWGTFRFEVRPRAVASEEHES